MLGSASWRQRGMRVPVDLDRPLEPITVPEDHTHVLLIVRCRGQHVGDAWLDASGPPATGWGARVIEPAVQYRALGTQLWDAIARTELRHRLEPLLSPDRHADADDVSVIVCTRDRPEALARCLDALGALDPPAHEVIVVDNAPRDAGETQRICAEREVTYVLEPLPGQSRARNRGIAESSGGLVAFTDDDCVPDPGWLQGLGRDFADPLVMCATGFIGPASVDAAAQLLFEAHGGFTRQPERRVFSGIASSPVLGSVLVGAGANMVFRRSAFGHVGAFAEHLGPGTPSRSSDDHEMFYRLLDGGFRIVHDPRRVIWHHHRADAASLKRILRDYGTSEFVWTLELFARRRELSTLKLWRWWLQSHYLDELKSLLRPGRGPVRFPPSLLANEIAGTLAAPRALRATRASRREIAPLEVGGGAVTERSPVVRSESAPPLTLAIASRNRAPALLQTLHELGGQSLAPDRFEVVVVLDGTEDDSEARLADARLPFRLRVVSQPHGGLARARNRGAEEAAHPVVVFFDDDITPAPDLLAAHAEAHRDGGRRAVLGPYPPAEGAGGFAERALHTWWVDHFRRLGEPGHRWSFTDVCDGNLSLPVALWRELGGFDEGFTQGRRQDYEFGIRLLQAGVELAYAPAASGIHRLDTTLTTRLANARIEGRWDIRIAERHPVARRRLPLSGLTPIARDMLLGAGRARTPARREAVLSAGRAILASAEASQMRQTWGRYFATLRDLHYALGVADALPDLEARRAFLRDEPAAEVVRHELGAAELPEMDVAVATPLLEITMGGAPVARVPVILPGGQWDGAELLDRAVDAAGWFSALQTLQLWDHPEGAGPPWAPEPAAV